MAFNIDGETRERLIGQDKRSAELIMPLLRGRDDLGNGKRIRQIPISCLFNITVP